MEWGGGVDIHVARGIGEILKEFAGQVKRFSSVMLSVFRRDRQGARSGYHQPDQGRDTNRVPVYCGRSNSLPSRTWFVWPRRHGLCCPASEPALDQGLVP